MIIVFILDHFNNLIEHHMQIIGKEKKPSKATEIGISLESIYFYFCIIYRCWCFSATTVTTINCNSTKETCFSFDLGFHQFSYAFIYLIVLFFLLIYLFIHFYNDLMFYQTSISIIWYLCFCLKVHIRSRAFEKEDCIVSRFIFILSFIKKAIISCTFRLQLMSYHIKKYKSCKSIGIIWRKKIVSTMPSNFVLTEVISIIQNAKNMYPYKFGC